MRDIWSKTMDLAEFEETFKLIQLIQDSMYDRCIADYCEFMGEHAQEEDFECGYFAGVISAIAYIKEGDHHDGE